MPAVARTRVCLGCLRDDHEAFDGPLDSRPYRRNWWIIPNISSCPYHALPLLDACPNCQSAFNPLQSPIRCNCNPHFDLRQFAQVRLDEEALDHDRWLLGRIGVGEKVAHELLDSMSPDTASRLCFIVGASSKKNCLIIKRNITSKMAAEFNNAGWTILNDWPKNFHAALDGIVFSRKQDGPKNVSKGGLYQPLVRYLWDERGTDELEVIRQYIRDHARQHLAVTPNTRILGKAVGPGRLTTLRATVEDTGVGVPHAEEICKELGISLDQDNPRGSLITRADAARIEKYCSQVIPRSALAGLLGCSSETIAKLIDNGTLRVRLKREFDVLIWRDEVDQLSEFLEIPERKPNPSEACIQHILTIVRCEFYEMMVAALKGSIKPVCRTRNKYGWRGFCFSIKEAYSATLAVTGMEKLHSILKRYGWQSRTIAHLRRLGYLDKNDAAMLIDPATVADFAARYVWMKEMFEWEGAPVTRSAIRRRLAERGIKPIFARLPSVTTFWPRAEAEWALRESRMG
ncbi:hypothetical protein EGM87_14715 [Sphingobium sp. RSMS]|nr:hypothetical protein EGM87_14715 [Sphingobium sp. RSMS]